MVEGSCAAHVSISLPHTFQYGGKDFICQKIFCKICFKERGGNVLGEKVLRWNCCHLQPGVRSHVVILGFDYLKEFLWLIQHGPFLYIDQEDPFPPSKEGLIHCLVKKTEPSWSQLVSWRKPEEVSRIQMPMDKTLTLGIWALVFILWPLKKQFFVSWSLFLLPWGDA